MTTARSGDAMGLLHGEVPVTTRYAPSEAVADRRSASLLRATHAALEARTPQQFGHAFEQLLRAAGRTQGDVVRRDAAHSEWLSRSTVSRMVNGTTLCRRREQVEAFVNACGAKDYVDAWIRAWEQVHEHRNMVHNEPPAEVDTKPGADHKHTDTRPSDEGILGASRIHLSGVVAGQASSDDDVLLDVHVRVTAEHIRGAAPLLLAMGALTAANGVRPNGRALATMALAGTAGVVLLSTMQRLASDDMVRRRDTTVGTTGLDDVYITVPPKLGSAGRDSTETPAAN